MKYCTKCGSRVADDARFCYQCGATVPQPTPQNTYQTAPQNTYQAVPQSTYQPSLQAAAIMTEEEALEKRRKKFATVTAVFRFLTDLFLIFTCFWLALSIAGAYVSLHGYTSTYSAYWGLNEDFACLAMLQFIPSTSLAITHFVLTLVGRQRAKDVFSAIKRLILPLLLLIVAVAFFEGI